MKPGVIFINTARASVVDEKALIRYLKNGKIRCAVIDVHENEPWGVNKELVFLPNVLATPHIAGVSKEAIKRVSHHIVKSVINFFKKGDLSNAINKPINSFKPKKKK
jgi:phosphoglycerate dehydrogenase-like enzyme